MEDKLIKEDMQEEPMASEKGKNIHDRLPWEICLRKLSTR